MNKATKLKLVITSVLFISSLYVNAQVQKVSVRAPDNIRIDGNSSEWQDKLQVYNTPDRIFYTLSNDDNNLYLTVRAPGPYAIEKIMMGGITLSISHSVDKKIREKDAGKVAVTFPILHNEDDINNISINRFNWQILKKDTVANKGKMDELNRMLSKKLAAVTKEIMVSGIKDISEPALSVYNTEGIKAMDGFNQKMNYTYELAIPLKYLGFSTSSPVPFSYNIKLSGPRNSNSSDIAIVNGNPDPDELYVHSVTEFWAEYTLAVKN